MKKGYQKDKTLARGKERCKEADPGPTVSRAIQPLVGNLVFFTTIV